VAGDADWKLSDQALAAGLAAAEGIGAMRVSRAHDLGLGRITDTNGIELGKFKSDAETGFVLCQIHGHAKAVGSDGVWRQTGTCEWCFKSTHSKEAIAERKAIVGDKYEAELKRAVRERLEAEQAEIAAHRAAVDAAAAAEADPEAVVGALDAGPVPPVQLPEAARSVAGPARVEPRPAPRGPALGPGSIFNDSPLEWDDFLLLGTDLRAGEGARSAEGPGPESEESSAADPDDFQ
jgi:hypothetical protein